MLIKAFIFGLCVLQHEASGSFHYANSGEDGNEQDLLDEFFDADNQDVEQWKSRTLDRAATTCEDMDFTDFNITLQGAPRKASLLTDDGFFNWYQAECCCRSRDQHLATMMSVADAIALYEAVGLATISWVDANSFTGEWKSFLTDQAIDEDVFAGGSYPRGGKDRCGHLDKPAHLSTYEMVAYKCGSATNEKFICVDREEGLVDSCFSDWKGEGGFAPCAKATLIDYADHRVCPKLATPETCANLQFNEIELNDGRIGMISESAASFHWYGAECCCRSRGWHLVSVKDNADLKALWYATKNDDEISWVDATSFSGEWRTFSTDSIIDTGLFTDQKLTKDPPADYCGEISYESGGYKINPVPCKKQDSDLIVCEQRKETLTDNCFRSWEGADGFASCNKHSLDDFGYSRKCPLVGSNTHCDALQFKQVSMRKGDHETNGYVTQTAEELNWFGAFCCCRSRGWFLPEVVNHTDLDSIYQATNYEGVVGWSDAHTLIHEWTSIATGMAVNALAFEPGQKTPSTEARCGQFIEVDGTHKTYKLKDVECSLKEKRNLFCEERGIETFPDNCFSNWDGDDKFARCSQAAIKEFAESRSCPLVPPPTTTTTTTTSKPTPRRIYPSGLGPWGPIMGPWGPFAPPVCAGCFPGKPGCEKCPAGKVKKGCGACSAGKKNSKACAGCPGIMPGSGCNGCFKGGAGPGCAGCAKLGKTAGSSGSLPAKPFPYGSFDEHFHNAPVNMYSFLGGR